MKNLFSGIRGWFCGRSRTGIRPGIKRWWRTECIEPLEVRALLAAALVKDINAQLSTDDAAPSKITEAGGTIFFVANDVVHGLELWKTDGTANGTLLVKDIQMGHGSSSPRYLTNVNGTLFFSATDGVNGGELWKSDGTTAGTVMVKDIAGGGGFSTPTGLVNVNGILYFRASNGSSGYELWKSDGTAVGTVQVADIRSGAGGSSPLYLTNVNGTLFFNANDGLAGYELWKSDGTAAGTVLVRDIRNGTSSSIPKSLTNVNGTLYFESNDGTTGRELWKSDGTTSGTILVKDIRGGSLPSYPRSLANVNGTLFFSAIDGVNGYELWKSNGTSAGTVMVSDIHSGNGNSHPNYLTNVNGTLYFGANDGAHGNELWKSDGSAAGTVLVREVNIGNASAGLIHLTNVNGTLYFRADDGAHGNELWKSDGSAAGTVLVKDIRNGSGSSNIRLLANVNGTVYFPATDGVHGYELWKSDGTSSGTETVKEIMAGTGSSGPRSMVTVGDTIYFNANDGTNGYELWKSDGTEAGTMMVRDIRSGVDGSFPMYLTNVNGRLFFLAYDGVNGQELWSSDGTDSGTTMVKDIWSGSGHSLPRDLTNVNGLLYFTASDGTNGFELWKSDGTASGTVMVKDIWSGSGHSLPRNLTNVNGLLYFTASDGTNGIELWKSDGTTSGTELVKDIWSGSLDGELRFLVNVNGALYFRASDGVHGQELWKSDGTNSGTAMVKDIWNGSSSSRPGNLTNVSGLLYFTASDGVNGDELWTSDGTPSGTVMIKDIHSGSGTSAPTGLTNVNGVLYLRANDGVHGAELWKSDGTDVGTILVEDIFSGSSGSNPSDLTNLNGSLFFSAMDGLHGEELWQTDGTASGTVLAAEMEPGSAGANPAAFITLGDRLLYTAFTLDYGTELWIHVPNTVPTDISISSSVFGESATGLSVVGTLTALDPDAGETLTFTLVTGSGSDDNSSFQILGSELRSSPSFVAKSSQKYSVRIRVTDTAGASYEEVIVLKSNRLIDPAFSGDGIALTAVSDSVDQARTLAVQSDGRVIVAGRTLNGSRYDLAVVRYDLNGNPDSGFGSGGIATFTLDSAHLKPTSIVLDTANRIVVACEHQGSGIGDFVIFRLTPGGSLDTSFGNAGHTVVDIGAFDDRPQSLVIQPDGRILVAGESINATSGLSDVAIVRLLESGSPDTSFSSDGVHVESLATGDDGATDVLLQADGSIVIGGYALGAGGHWNFLSARFTPSGSLDPAFGVAGSVVQPIGSQSALCYSISELSDHRLVLTGFAWNETNVDPAFLRLTPAGMLDNRPGNDAVHQIPFTTSDDYFYGATIINDKILMVGNATDTSGELMAVLRLNSDGEPDSGFDGDGRLLIHPGYSGGTAAAVNEGHDGRLILTGLSSEGSRQRFATARLFNPEAPTDIELPDHFISENEPVGTVVGVLNAVDPNGYDSHQFALIDGPGDTDNAVFTISGGNSLIAQAGFDYESKSLFSIRVRTTDSSGLTVEKQLQVEITNANEQPVNAGLSNSTLPENQPSGTSVGVLSTADPDDGNAFTYALVAGPGDDDNGAFSIDGNTLKAAAVFNFEAKSSYSIRVRSTDQGGLSVESTFAVSVGNVTELNGIDVQLGQTQRSYVRYLDTLFDNADDLLNMISSGRFQLTKRDLDGNTPINVTLLPSMFSVSGSHVRLDFGSNGLGGNRNSTIGDGYYEIAVDTDGNGSYESRRNFYRLLGDVNGDRKVDATDSSLVVTAYGTSNANRDVNGDGIVNANDRTLVLRSIGRKLRSDLFADD